MMSGLTGRLVIVTRPWRQAQHLMAAIQAVGGVPFLFPLLEIAPTTDVGPLQRVAAQLERYDKIIFISPNAVDYSLPVLLSGRSWPDRVLTVAMGPGTLRALVAHGVQGTLMPSMRYDSAALLALPALQEVYGQHILILRGEGGRELLAETLLQRGACVEGVACYTRSPPAEGAAPFLDCWAERGIDAVTVSSSEGLRNLFALLSVSDWQRLGRIPFFVPHARIAETAATLGLRNVVLCDASDEGIIGALQTYNWRP